MIRVAVLYKGMNIAADAAQWEKIRQSREPFYALGEICDDERFGDNCNTDCPRFCQGDCPCVLFKTQQGAMWHLHPYSEMFP